MQIKISMLNGEHWWGGTIALSEHMPFDKDTKITVRLAEKRSTIQSAPLFVSDKGRYIWSDKGFTATFEKGEITCDGESEIFLNADGNTLREAFVNARKAHFPFKEKVSTPREFYELPQFNTWMELVKDQTEENILSYAQELVDNGYKRGILIIDDGWQEDHGVWRFNTKKFKDPKGMVDKLHNMGFKVLLWVAPWISPDSDEFLELSREKGVECDTGHLVRLKDGRVAIYKWWNGYSAMLDFTQAGDREYMQKQLDSLTNEYGVDGFKFDGGDYTWQPINACDTFSVARESGVGEDPMVYGWRTFENQIRTTDELNAAWVEFGMRYRLHEYKNTWNVGHLPVIQRLCDKSHTWGFGGLASLIPQGNFIGLIGNPFVCPDMVGGGSWIAFVYGKADEELFVRMAQCSALFPMMQFSALPWKKLSPPYAKLCLDMARLHEQMQDEIIKAVENAEKTGEPILRSLEYNYPNQGYTKINDEFMLGDNYLVAPVLEKGATSRKVVFPQGKWRDMTDGKIYEQGEWEVPASIEKLPYFKEIGENK